MESIVCFFVLKPTVSVFSSFFFFWCSPEHPLMRARGRSILGGEKQSFQEYAENAVASRFDKLCVCLFVLVG
jgi:hypothetical protein